MSLGKLTCYTNMLMIHKSVSPGQSSFPLSVSLSRFLHVYIEWPTCHLDIPTPITFSINNL